MVKNRLKEIRMTKYMMNSREFAEYLSVNTKTY